MIKKINWVKKFVKFKPPMSTATQDFAALINKLLVSFQCHIYTSLLI